MDFYVRIASAKSAIIVTNWHLVGDLMKKAGSSVMIAPTRTPDSTPVNREPWVAGFSPVILGARRMVPSLEGGSVFLCLHYTRGSHTIHPWTQFSVRNRGD